MERLDTPAYRGGPDEHHKRTTVMNKHGESCKPPLVDLRPASSRRRRLHRTRYAEQKAALTVSHRHLDLNLRQVPESAGRCPSPSHGNAWASWHMQLRRLCSQDCATAARRRLGCCLDGSAEVKSGYKWTGEGCDVRQTSKRQCSMGGCHCVLVQASVPPMLVL